MKNPFLLTILLTPALALAQNTYKTLPVIKATNVKAFYRIGDEKANSNWNISPELSPDVLKVSCFAGKEKVFFNTDKDSVSYTLKPGESKQFYVLLNDKDYALTELKGVTYPAVKFEEKSKKAAYTFRYEIKPEDNVFLKQLRDDYNLNEVVKGAKNDTEKALKVMNWVHNQWKHNGSNQPSKSDALTILQEAKEGKQFRCVEYGIVTASALNAVGLKSRVLALKTKDVETTESGAGHVVLETYLNDLGKWVMLDSQWDAMPALKGKPLNAVEFQNAIVNNYEPLEIKSLSGLGKRTYANWIAPYLYYFDVKFDNREGELKDQLMVSGKKSLMLVPSRAKNPTVFQKQWPINNCVYTNSLVDFYAKPQ
ncbi:transglutaminase-like domain-containing protein [Adhaeribacter soli]|uniref:Transglutaminase domain-containing protein n=1 Tax=Adhaeribacter soli TaxID=2607655 RepID=A0A5N1J3U2_9BACT|nr:transglutaminase-like domain-containing protein [Adhaeribacter soli]KAA9345566.1 transglutaminase domain-containing protein [Adhaeribacter soli]